MTPDKWALEGDFPECNNEDCKAAALAEKCSNRRRRKVKECKADAAAREQAIAVARNKGFCVAWVQTKLLGGKSTKGRRLRTCEQFCSLAGKKCVKAEDDAEQVPCTIHHRTPREISCSQQRNTQMCTCTER